MSKFEVIRGVEGCCLALDDTRIAGPKPWGGGTVIHAWEIGERTRAAIDDWMAAKDGRKSRWHELFGTPERAARTSWFMLMCKEVDCNDCPIADGCDIATDIDCNDGEAALLEWLNQEVDA